MKFYIMLVILLTAWSTAAPQDVQKADSLNKLLKNANDAKTKVDLLNELSLNNINSDMSMALAYADSALALAKKNSYKEGIALAYTHTGYANHRKGNYETALTSINKAIGMYEVLDRKEQIAKLLLTVSQIYHAQSKFPKAIDYCKKSLLVKEEIGDSSELELNYLTFGVIYYSRADYDLALKNLFISVDYCKKNNNHKTLASNYNNIAIVYRQQENYDLALEYYRKAEEAHKIMHNRLGEAQAINNMAVIYELLAQPDLALQNYQKALDVFTNMGYKTGTCTALTNIAGIEIARNNLADVPEKLKKAQVIAAEIEDEYKMGSIYGLWGQYYLAQNNFEKAIEYSLRALKTAEKSNAKKLYANLLMQISEIYERFDFYEKALEYYKLYHDNLDSIYSVEKTETIEKLNAEFRFKETEAELEIQAKEIELLEKTTKIARIKSFVLLLVLVILGLLIGFGLLYHFRKINSQKTISAKNIAIKESEKKILQLEVEKRQVLQKSLQDELKYKNQEIQNFALHIINKNEFINKIKKDLKAALKIKSSVRENTSFREILNKINGRMLLERDREEFLAHVDNLSENFHYNLKQKYPELTETEVRIASLLRMDFSSKEIAAILHITPKSVDTNRYRIRKKLKIEPEIKMNDFFKNI